MRKNEQDASQSTSIRHARVLLDDVDLIIESLKSRSLHVTLRDKDFIYENIDEVIKKHGDRPPSLEIQGQRDGAADSITIAFHGNRTSVAASRIPADLYHDIVEQVQRRVPFLMLSFKPFVWAATIMAFMSTCNDSTILFTKTKPNLHVDVNCNAIFQMALCCAFLWIAFGIYSRKYLRLTLRRRCEGGFWKQHSDKLLYLIVGAAIAQLAPLIVKLITAIIQNSQK